MDDLLYLTHRVPCPPHPGDKTDQTRSYHLLKYLSRHFRVHLGCLVADGADRQHVEHLKTLCAASCFVNLRPAVARLRGVRGLLSGQAMSLPYYRDARLQRWVDRLLAGGRIERALACSGPMAQYLSADAARPLRRVVDFVDVDSEQWRRSASGKAWPLGPLYRREARCLQTYETGIAQQFDGATFISQAEAALFRQRAPEARQKLDYFNNGIDSDYFSPLTPHRNPYPDGSTVLVFHGAMDAASNIDAAVWFAGAVLPMLRGLFPQICLYIVGARPAPAVMALARLPGVIVTGAVPDSRPYLAHAVLAVAPLRIGRGAQGKVLEAMSMQKTVVGSALAFDGINAQPGSELLLAAGADDFVRQIALQLRGKANRSLGQAARQRILQDYRWDRNLERLGALLGLPQASPAAHGARRLHEPAA